MEGLHHITTSSTLNIDTPAIDRFPQWSIQETSDFLLIRAELDPTFMETKHNKILWEVFATRMKEKGYNRSAEQCKCKWKHLVTRYKGCETMEQEGMRQAQFPFYNEVQAIFDGRMQQMLWMEAEGGGGVSGSGSKKKALQLTSDEEGDNEELIRDRRKKRSRKGKGTSTIIGGNSNHLKDVLEELLKQQMQMEMEWLKAYEAREEQRRMKEMEWRQTMEALQNERIMMDNRWREKEEQRRIIEETRAQKRDALITALLNKLRRQEM